MFNPEKKKSSSLEKMFSKSEGEKGLEEKLAKMIEPAILDTKREWGIGGALQLVTVSMNPGNPSEFTISAVIKNPESFLNGTGYYNTADGKITSISLKQGEKKKHIDNIE